MPRYNKTTDLTPAQADTILIAIENHNVSNRKIAKKINYSKSTIKTFKKRVYAKINKKNISSLQIVNIKSSHIEKFSKLNVRNRKRLIKHTIKNKTNQRKL